MNSPQRNADSFNAAGHASGALADQTPGASSDALPGNALPPLPDNSGARQRILSRIRERQGRVAALKPTEEANAASYLQAHPRGPVPSIDPQDIVPRFVRESERMASTVDRVATLQEVPVACARWLAEKGLGAQAVVWPSMAHLDWASSGLTTEFRAPQDPDLVGITGVFCAIAETGTLMLLSGPDTPASMALLPETHIAVIPVSRIVAHMEDGFDLMRSERIEPTRAINFISGPSRTGDIEQTIVLGAHGPYRVHLILVEQA